jgi:hypothetical protein
MVRKWQKENLETDHSMATGIEQKNHAHEFYTESLKLLNESGYPFLLGGAFALREFTGIYRDTKDLDVFCRAGDYLRILKFFSEKGFRTEITDARWLSKVFKGDHFIDLIFDSVNNICRVDDSWFAHAVKSKLFGIPVLYIAPEELIWSKIYVHNRERYDGADLNHIFLKNGKQLDWQRLLTRLDLHWQLLLGQLINFQFVYPSERDIVPKWLFDELLLRAREQYDFPASIEKICLGPIIDQTQYKIDIKEWDFKVVTMRTV